MKEKIREFLKDTFWIYKIVAICIPFAYIVSLFFPSPFPLWFYLLLPLMQLLLFVAYIGFSENVKKEYRTFRWSLLPIAFLPANLVRKWMEIGLKKDIPIILEILFSFVFAALLTYFLFINNREKEKNIVHFAELIHLTRYVS